MEKIQIGVALGENSSAYVNFLINSIIKTVSDPERIELMLAINKPGINKEDLLIHSEKIDITVIEAITPERGSKGHGHCLDKMLGMMTSKYGMFVDCDVAFLKKDWDQILIEKLKDNIVAIGGDTDPSNNHYKNFPFSIMVMFDVPTIKKCDISFKPAQGGDYRTKLSEENCHIFNEKPGAVIHLDTCWQLPYKLKANGFDGIALPMLSPRLKSKNMIFMKEDMRGEEYVLNDVSIATHVGRSMSRNFYTHEAVIKWRHEVNNWLKKFD